MNTKHHQLLNKYNRENYRKKWFKEAKELWDRREFRASRRLLDGKEDLNKILIKIEGNNRLSPVHKASLTTLQILFNPNDNHVCPVCKKGHLTYRHTGEWSTGCCRSCSAVACKAKREATMIDKYGVSNPSQSETIKKRRTQTIKKRYGVENAFQSKDLMKKAKKTMLERYGVENASQSEEIQRRKEATSIANCGKKHWTQDNKQKHKLVPFNEVTMAKAKRTMLRRYGADNPFKIKAFQKQIQKTLIRKYGVDNIFKSENFAQISAETCLKRYGKYPWEMMSNTRCKYKDNNGKIHNVQGFEPLALEWLDTRKYKVRLVTGAKRVPRIRYKVLGKERTYYPDIVAYTKTTKKVIEVKGTFTLLHDMFWEMNKAKFRAANKYCKENGFEFWLYLFAYNKMYRIKFPTAQKLRDLGLL